MILLLPVGLLLVAAFTIFILNQFRPNFGTSWLIASVGSILAWLVILFLRLRLPTILEVLDWYHAELNLKGALGFELDYQSWSYVLALITITLAVILTDAARTRYDSTPLSWAFSLTATAFGLLSLQAGTSLTLMIIWVVVDVLELIYLLHLPDIDRFLGRLILAYGVRTASVLLLFLGTIQGWQSNAVVDLTQIPQNAAFLFLLAAGFRLGTFPLNLPFLQEPNLRRGVGNIIRLVPAASGLALLARLPADLIPQNLVLLTPFFHMMLAIAALYASLRWLTAKDEIEGRPFWLIAWSSLATASVLNSASSASLAWGLALLLPGSLLFLYYPRIQRMNFLLYFGLIGLVGIPYTPLASGWEGLMANGFNFWTIIFVLTHTIMILGYLNRIIQPGGEAGSLESWARLVYPLGLIIIIQAIVTIGLVGWPGSLTLGTWWLALASLLLVSAAVILSIRLGITTPYAHLPANSNLFKALNWLAPRLEPIFRLEWVYRIIWQINRLLGFFLKSFSTILESEGGILWTILLLVLLITILTGGVIN